MTEIKYHIKPNGEAAKCSATVQQCKYGSKDQHYSTVEAARTAYELSQATKTLITLQKEEKNNNAPITEVENDALGNFDVFSEEFRNAVFERIEAPDFVYEFEKKMDDYGIVFESPDTDTAYIEENEDGSVFHRFEQLDELFEEFTEEDVQEGYSLNVPLHTVQQYVSEDLVNYYAATGETDSITAYEDEENDQAVSLMRILVHKDKLYVIDGNHRFAAARVAGEQSFKGVVMGMDDDMNNMWVVPPEHFNQMYSQDFDFYDEDEESAV